MSNFFRHIGVFLFVVVMGTALTLVFVAGLCMNIANAMNMTGAGPYWWMLAMVPPGADVAKACILIFAGWALSARLYGRFLAACAIFLVLVGYSIANIANFAATSVTDTVSTRGRQAVIDNTLTDQVKAQCELPITMGAEKLQRPRKDWAAIEEAIDAADRRCEVLRQRAAGTRATGKDAPGAELLAGALGMKAETWVQAQPILTLLVIEVLGAFGPLILTSAYAQRPQRRRREAAGEAVSAPITSPAPLPAPSTAPPPSPAYPVGSGTSVQSRTVEKLTKPPRKRGKGEKPESLTWQIEALLGELESRFGDGRPVTTGEAFTTYDTMAKARGWSFRMGPSKFAHWMEREGIDKTEPDKETKVVHWILPTAKEKAARLRGKRAAS